MNVHLQQLEGVEVPVQSAKLPLAEPLLLPGLAHIFLRPVGVRYNRMGRKADTGRGKGDCSEHGPAQTPPSQNKGGIHYPIILVIPEYYRGLASSPFLNTKRVIIIRLSRTDR